VGAGRGARRLASGKVRAGRAVRRKGPRRGLLAREERKRARRERCGPQGREGEVGRVVLGLFSGFYFSGFLFYSKHHLNLFEFKLKFEFNSYAFKSNKIKPCTSMNATTI
jgi:hypothetical protein